MKLTTPTALQSLPNRVFANKYEANEEELALPASVFELGTLEEELLCVNTIDSTQRDKLAIDLVKPSCLSECAAIIPNLSQLVLQKVLLFKTTVDTVRETCYLPDSESEVNNFYKDFQTPSCERLCRIRCNNEFPQNKQFFVSGSEALGSALVRRLKSAQDFEAAHRLVVYAVCNQQ